MGNINVEHARNHFDADLLFESLVIDVDSQSPQVLCKPQYTCVENCLDTTIVFA